MLMKVANVQDHVSAQRVHGHPAGGSAQRPKAKGGDLRATWMPLRRDCDCCHRERWELRRDSDCWWQGRW